MPEKAGIKNAAPPCYNSPIWHKANIALSVLNFGSIFILPESKYSQKKEKQ